VGRDGNRTRYECSDSQNRDSNDMWVPVSEKTLEELVDSLYLHDSFKVKDVEVLYCQ
jgi:hypothetical protein